MQCNALGLALPCIEAQRISVGLVLLNIDSVKNGKARDSDSFAQTVK